MTEEPNDTTPATEEPASVPAESSCDSVEPECPASGGVLFAALLTAAGSMVLFVCSSRPAIVAGPWQEWLAGPHTIYQRPLLSTWLAYGVVALAGRHALPALYVFSILLGSAAAGVVAALAASARAGRATRVETVACGAAAGFLFAFTQPWLAASTAYSPTALTVLLALSGCLLVLAPAPEHRKRAVLAGALFWGLAVANAPSLGAAAVLFSLVAIAFTPSNASVVGTLAIFALGAGAGVSLPVVAALVKGETVAAFLSHALKTPYPTLGDGAPQFGFLNRLLTDLPWPTLAAAIPGLLLILRRDSKRFVLPWALMFLCLGPFLPTLVNHSTDPTVLNDEAVPVAMVTAALCLFAAWGIFAVTRLAVRGKNRAAWRAATVAVLAGILVSYQAARFAPAPSNAPRQLAEAVLSDCPENAILVTGNARIHSLLHALQTVTSERLDITLVPADALDSTRLRLRLQESGSIPNTILSRVFPPEDAMERWGKERPLEMDAVLKAQNQSKSTLPYLRDLALWELLRDNFKARAQRPICFAGVSSPWLTARAQCNGVVLVYPRRGPTPDASLKFLQSLDPELRQAPPLESELSRTAVDLLLPLSDAARRQANHAVAAETSALACRFAATDKRAWIASARAAARHGDRKQAMNFMERYLMLAPDRGAADSVTQAVQEDLARNALADQYVDTVRNADPVNTDRMELKQLASDLWACDELSVLAGAYDLVHDRYLKDGDVNAMCDGAAVLTQLGELDRAREELKKAISINIFSVRDRLRSDPRFDLLVVDTEGKRGAQPG